MRPRHFFSLLFLLAAPVAAQPQAPGAFETPLAASDLDPAAFVQWADGAEKPMPQGDGPRHVVWTRDSALEWDGAAYGDSKTPGVRHLRIGFKTAVPIGAVLARAGGQLSVLKPGAAYPGNVADETQWLPAQRLKGRAIGRDEPEREEYALWLLPPGTTTRALRFTHTAAATDNKYEGWLGGVFVLRERVANVAPQAVAAASARDEIAGRINNASNDGTWSPWDNGAQGGVEEVSPEHPAWVLLAWPAPVALRGLNALWAGFGAAEMQVYTGPANVHPREAPDADWKTLRTFDKLENQYPRQLGPNWLDFGATVTMRALRLRLTSVTRESHPHLNGNTKGGKRVWLGELMALAPLGNADLKTALLPAPSTPTTAHPPIAVRFTLPEPGFVTLVIEGWSGKRVRNLVADTFFPAGPNVVWWDGTDDLGRDTEAARHGLYHIPAQFVQPGLYRVRGLVRKAIDLRYEFSLYNAGNPAWETADRTGAWLTNHTPPSSALFVPGERTPNGKPMVFLGSYVAEGGHGLAWVDLEGRKQGGQGWVGGNWTGAPFLAADAGAGALPGVHAYAGSAWATDNDRAKGEIRLTALTKDGDRPVLKYVFTPQPAPGEVAGTREHDFGPEMGGLAARDGLLVASLSRSNQLLFVDAALGRVRGLAALDDPRGLAFDAQGRLLVLSGTKLLRCTLPDALAPAPRLDPQGWTATASTHNEDAGKAIDADANSRWSTNGGQAAGQWFTLDMKTPQTFSTLALRSNAAQDSPRGYEVYVSNDGQNWGEALAKGAGTANTSGGVTTISFPRATARFVKIVQTGAAPDAYWSINALDVFNLPPDAANAVQTLPAPEVVVAGLQDPKHVAQDAADNFFISDRGDAHQVKVFGADGKFLRAIGHAGTPKAGPYDPLHMNNPNGLAVDANGHLWVAETDYQPKRVSVWTLDGQLWKAFYGPSEYGGGGTLDPRDKTKFYYHGMEFRLDWKSGANAPVQVFSRPGPDDLKTPDGYGSGGLPETPLYFNGRRYFTNCYTSNPTNGAGVALLWLERDGLAAPVAALGRANDWSLLKGDAFKPSWPAGVDLKGDYGKNQAVFAWSDLDGDAHVQPNEVTFQKATGGGFTVMPDGAFVASRIDDKAVRFAPRRFTPAGVPVYDLTAGQTLVEGAQGPTTSGGDQALVSPDSWTVLTVAPKPFAPQGLGGVKNGVPLWSYPSLWPGLHASHEAPAPDRPGEIIGTTRLLSGFVTPKGEAGPLWAINGNMGNMYLFTADGLFVAELFRDVRQGRSWSMPIAQRGMLLNGLSLHDENFWPSIAQTSDGQIYLVDGGRTSLVRVDGLDTIRRLPAQQLRLTADDLKAAQQFFVQSEAARQQTLGQKTLKVALRLAAPVVDGKLDDWAGADWAVIDRSGVGANFDSNSKPYDVTAAVAVAGDRLFAAFKTGDRDLLRNSGETANAPFKNGGALDVMLGTDPAASANRTRPVVGDLRLLVTIVKNKPLALLYRAVTPVDKQPVPFSSPWRTITFDRVDNVSDQVQLAGTEGDFELSIPLAAIGLKPEAGQTLKGDLGVLRGNGFQTLQRVYWSNKATAITADVPSEAELTPQLWGKWQFVTP